MALNKKIVAKIKEKTGEDLFIKSQLPLLLSRIESGRQPKREIVKIMEELNYENRIY
jgi:hypothetical protein